MIVVMDGPTQDRPAKDIMLADIKRYENPRLMEAAPEGSVFMIEMAV
ncbi:hypothetical protein [Yoonia sp. 2307UL14-13]